MSAELENLRAEVAQLRARVEHLEKPREVITSGGKGRNNTWGVCSPCGGAGRLFMRDDKGEPADTECAACGGRGQGRR